MERLNTVQPLPSFSKQGEQSGALSEAISNVSELVNTTIEQFSWTFYYDEGNQRASKPRGSMVKLGSFTSVEAFWTYFNRLDKSLDGICKTGKFNLRLFKGSIQPNWQDASNINGGKWVVSCRQQPMEKVREIWCELILSAISAKIPQYHNLCGVALAQRDSQREIQIWVNNDPLASTAGSTDPTSGLDLAVAIRQMLNIPSDIDLRYHSHQSLMNRRLDMKRDTKRVVKVSTKQTKAQTWPSAEDQTGESKVVTRDVESLDVKLNIGHDGSGKNYAGNSLVVPSANTSTPATPASAASPALIPASATAAAVDTLLAPALLEEDVEGQSTLSVSDAASLAESFKSGLKLDSATQQQQLLQVNVNTALPHGRTSRSGSVSSDADSEDSDGAGGDDSVAPSAQYRSYLAQHAGALGVHPSPGALVKALLATVGDGSPAALAAAAAALIPDSIPRALARSMRKKARRKLNRLKRKRLMQLQQMAKDGLIPHSSIPQSVQAVSLTSPPMDALQFSNLLHSPTSSTAAAHSVSHPHQTSAPSATSNTSIPSASSPSSHVMPLLVPQHPSLLHPTTSTVLSEQQQTHTSAQPQPVQQQQQQQQQQPQPQQQLAPVQTAVAYSQGQYVNIPNVGLVFQPFVQQQQQPMAVPVSGATTSTSTAASTGAPAAASTYPAYQVTYVDPNTGATTTTSGATGQEYYVIPEQYVYDVYDMYGYQYTYDPYSQQMVYVAPVQTMQQQQQASVTSVLPQPQQTLRAYAHAGTAEYPLLQPMMVPVSASAGARMVNPYSNEQLAKFVAPSTVSLQQQQQQQQQQQPVVSHAHNRDLLRRNKLSVAPVTPTTPPVMMMMPVQQSMAPTTYVVPSTSAPSVQPNDSERHQRQFQKMQEKRKQYQSIDNFSRYPGMENLKTAMLPQSETQNQ